MIQSSEESVLRQFQIYAPEIPRMLTLPSFNSSIVGEVYDFGRVAEYADGVSCTFDWLFEYAREVEVNGTLGLMTESTFVKELH